MKAVAQVLNEFGVLTLCKDMQRVTTFAANDHAQLKILVARALLGGKSGTQTTPLVQQVRFRGVTSIVQSAADWRLSEPATRRQPHFSRTVALHETEAESWEFCEKRVGRQARKPPRSATPPAWRNIQRFHEISTGPSLAARLTNRHEARAR